MLARRIIPCLDVADGVVVKGVRFQDHVVVGSIVELAQRYARAGADELVFYDITASPDGRSVDLAWVRAVAGELDIPFCVAGGIRSVGDAEAVLAAGADKVSVNSPALVRPALIDELAQRFGSQCVVIGMDVRNGRLVLALDLRLGADGRWWPATQAWRQTSDVDAGDLLERFAGAGITDVLSTDIGSDGMGAGPNLALYRWLLGRWPGLHWIASGGVRDQGDLDALADLGVPACVAGTALLEGTLPVGALRGRGG